MQHTYLHCLLREMCTLVEKTFVDVGQMDRKNRQN